MNNDNDAKGFIGKNVEQVRCLSPEYQKFVGRKSKVVDAFTDERGVIQVQTADGVWCPFFLLAVE